MRVTIKRLFHGKASPRDYHVKECLDKGEDLVIYREDTKEVMTVSNADIKKGYINPNWIESKHTPGLKYRLVDYTWKTDSDTNLKLNL